jgi:thiol-disulfide isomerase/thioredoxin
MTRFGRTAVLASCIALALPASQARAQAGIEWTKDLGRALDRARTEGKPVLIDFWATWCGPCREELPELERLRKEYEPKGVTFLTVNLDSDVAAAAAMARQLGIGMAVGLDSDRRVADAYQLPTMPTSYVIDRKGTIRFLHEGFHGGADVERFRRELEQLLAE